MDKQRRNPKFLVLAMGLVLVAGAARAQDSELAPLRSDLRIDVPVTSVAILGRVGAEALKGHLAAPPCPGCDRDPDGGDVLNGLDASVRNALRWNNSVASDTASSITGFALAPLAALGLHALAAGHDERPRDAPFDILLIASTLQGGRR